MNRQFGQIRCASTTSTNALRARRTFSSVPTILRLQAHFYFIIIPRSFKNARTIDPYDIAVVAEVILTAETGTHEDRCRIYELTGSEVTSFGGMTSAPGTCIGKEIWYIEV